jgi:hypothetical protein
MTLAELEALPTVSRLFAVEMSFVDRHGRAWDVGRTGTIWAKA